MRGQPEWVIKTEKVYKTKKNENGMFVARIVQIPKKEDLLDFVLVIENKKNKEIVYREILVTTDNDYYSFRLARGNMKWVSLHTVAVWDKIGQKLVEVSALTRKENYRIADEHCSQYRKK